MGISTISIGKVKFNWRGNWAPSTAYVKDDVVKYGPNVYIITISHTSASTFTPNIAKTQLMVEGVTWEDTYNPATLYQVNDIVGYGGAIYVCTQEGTGQTPSTASAYWDRLVGGLEFEGNWASGTQYQKGDIVRYGGYTYVAAQDSLGDNPATATGYWSILNKGLTYIGAFNNSIIYAPGETVSYGGNQYVVKEGINTIAGTEPNNNTYWELVVKGYNYVGTYSTTTTYYPGQLVTYGGRIYAALDRIAQPTPVLPTDTNSWFVFSEGTRWRGDWTQGDSYIIGDLVSWGGYNYICIAAASGYSQRPVDTDYWQVYVKGINWRNEWASTTDYRPGDAVSYGGRSYICTTEVDYDGSSIVQPTNGSYWNVLSDGQEFRDSWSSANSYKIGDIVRHGARSYICVQGYTGDGTDTNGPENATYWSILNKGLDWKGVWSSSSVAYKLDDVVEYSGSSYVCIDSHTSTGGLTPDTATGYWQALAVGDISSPMTTTGDMIYRNSVGGIVRLPIGGNGAYLVVNNGIPSWGVQAPERNYYVSTTGDDANDGRTIATAWRTLQHACTQTFSVGQCKISILAGTYNELTPIKVGRYVVLEGDGLGSVTISPDTTTDKGYGVGISKDGSTPNANSEVFHVNNGARIRNLVFRNFSTGAVCVSLDPGTSPNDTSVWITSQSPYVQNCTSFTDGGTGMIIDGARHNGGYKSIVANDWTQLNSDGYGIIVRNDGRSELVSCFTYYCYIGYLAESGGKIRAVGGNNSYGTYGSVARGFSQAETPLAGYIQLSDATINSVQTLTASSNIHIFTTYRDFTGNLFCVGHTNPTASDGSSTWSNTASYPVILKFDSAGGIAWFYRYDSSYGALHTILEFDDGVYAGGVIYSGGANKGFLIKVSQAGEIQWQKIISDTTEVVDITTDGTDYLYALANHTTYGATVTKVLPSGVASWSRAIDYNDSSINTLVPQSICYGGQPTTSTDSYANEGDATAQDNLFIAVRNSVTNEQMIARMSNAGVLLTAYNYGVQFIINKLRLDTGNGDGIYMVAGGYYDPAGAATKNPAVMRVSVTGVVEWQIQIADADNGEIKDVIPFGDDVYVAGYVNDTDSTDIYNKGFVSRLTSTGTADWTYTFANNSDNVVLNSVTLDGINVIAGGNVQRSGVIFNVQRDTTGGIGTVSSGSWVFANLSPTITDSTLASRNIQNVYSQTITLALSDTSLTLNQSPGVSRNIQATRTGFTGIGRGINFTVTGLTRQPKQGSVIQIAGDSETYFCIEVGDLDVDTATITLDPPIPSNKTPNDNTSIIFREAFSQVRMTSHDFLDIGTGGFASTNYPVIISADYTQAPDQLKETLSEQGGRVFYVTTDQDGNFRVGDYFKVEQATGRSTINAQEFNLSGLNELQLGSITAGRQGATVNEFSTDGTLSGNSDSAVPTERAVKTYVDGAVLSAIGAANTLVVGTAPNESKVKVNGTGANTDTIDFDINGTEILQIDNTDITFKPGGVTRFRASEYWMFVPKGTTLQRPGTPAAGYFRYNTDLSAFEGYDGSQWSGIGGGNPWTTKTGNYTAVNNDRLFVDTSSTAITITLPATPAVGDSVRILDLAGTFATNNLTVGRNSRLINGQADNLLVAQNNAGFQLVYTGSSYGWKLVEL